MIQSVATTKSKKAGAAKLSGFGAAVLVVGFLIYWLFDIRGLYTWADREIASHATRGWVVLKRFDNASSLSLPWTLIWKPVTRVVFVAPESATELPQETSVRRLLIAGATIDFDNRVDRWRSVYVIDLANRRFATFDADTATMVDLIEPTKWLDAELCADYIIEYAKSVENDDPKAK